GCAFPIQNLPLGVFRARGETQARIGVAIGDCILPIAESLPGETLNGYCAMAACERRDLRYALSRALERGSPKRELFAQSDCEMLLPVAIGDYTDFYASIDH